MSAPIKYFIISFFYKYLILFLFWISCFIILIPAFSHGNHYSEKEIETALSVFEKVILLSPELIEKTTASSVTPFYKVNGHKIPLNDGFWNLTKAWLRIYIQEVENYCPCDLDPEIMIQTAKKHFPQSLPKQKINKSKASISSLSNLFTQSAAKYGYTFAVAQLAFETAEAIFFTFVGLPGAHAFCNIGNIAITFTNRIIQKYTRAFSNGQSLSASGLMFSLRMAWLSRQVRKSQSKVFFIIEEILSFDEERLEKVNKTGPKEHRLLWLNRLKQKTDPLIEKQIELESELETEYYNIENQLEEGEDVDKMEKLKKQMEKLQNKINNHSQVNKKSFFGNRFKRYLFLFSRKGQTAYMTGHHLSDKILGKKVLWPLAVQENIFEQVLGYKTQTHSLETEPDEIQKALVEEFLSKRQNETESLFKEEPKVVYSLLESIEQIFDTTKDTRHRLMITQSIENSLAVLFSLYFKTSLSILEKKYNLSYKELFKLNWVFGRFFHSVYEFSDFLSSVSITKNKDKIKFYKYESMEKLLAFLDYLYEVQLLLKNTQHETAELFDRLQMRNQHLLSLSLLQKKKTAFSLIPFKKGQAQCKKLVEQY
ncbi:MAG: hypothetical protein OXN83_03485 [Oligoflexia bacterium]|nr:hypothetical protein [Oligoflexia bacterium]